MEGDPAPHEEESEEGLKYADFVSRLEQLGLEVTIDKDTYDRASRAIKKLIFTLLERLQELQRAGEGVLRLELSREDVEYIIYRLRTVYGDPRATSIVAKLADALRSAG